MKKINETAKEVLKDFQNRMEERKSFDIVGFVAICLAMGCLQIVLDKGEQFNWFDTTWICWTTICACKTSN